MTNRLPRPPRRRTRPNIIKPFGGGPLRLAVFELGDELDTDAFEKVAEDLGGELCGYVFDNERPELVTLQVREGDPDRDLRWARKQFTEGMDYVTAVLTEHADGGTTYHGTASTEPGPPRFEFLLSFGGDA